MSTHVARIAKVDSVAPIPNADRIQTAFVLGIQVIVSKEIQPGAVGVLFDGELALSDEYCRENNLYRHSNLNKDKDKTGFFEDNRRVRVQKFLKQKSEGLFMSLDSLSFTGYNISKLSLGDTFDELNGVKICEKYISEKNRRAMANREANQKKVKVVEAPMFKEHVDSEQLPYYIDQIPEGALITIEHKWHGTSGRATYTKTNRQLAKWKQFINKFYPIFSGEKWEYLAGTRRVVLFPENYDKVGFHGVEQYRFDILETFKPYLAKGQTIYFEIVGFVNGGSIMPKHDAAKMKDDAILKKYGKEIIYKYGCLQDQYKVKVYRITYTTEDGQVLDFTSQQVIDWCEKRGFMAAKPLVPRFVYDGNKEKLLALAKELADRPDKLCEDYFDPSHINEGVVVRVEHGFTTPMFLKQKSFPFKVLEGIEKEKDEVNIEEIS